MLFRSKTGGAKTYFKSGGVKVPGGRVVPIPNSNAVEFKGNTHAEGGIMLDKNTEVENEETMGPVKMANGGMNNYFFSSFLKYGGQSFADHHKQILAEGGDQAKIQQLAKLQEAVANKRGEKDRSPNTIASPKYISKLGGIRKYKTGGAKQIPPKNKSYIDSTPWSSAFISFIYKNADSNFPNSPTHTGYASNLKNDPNWEVLDPKTTKIKPGDIIINNRAGNTQKYNQKSYSGKSHGDIVTKIENDKAYAIGGNVSSEAAAPDTVAERIKNLKNEIGRAHV